MTSQALSLFLAANHLSVSSIPNFKAREMQTKRKGGGGGSLYLNSPTHLLEHKLLLPRYIASIHTIPTPYHLYLIY